MVHPGSALMTGMFSCILSMFCLSKEHPHMFFFISKSFCKSCISPEYSNSHNSHFSPSNLVLLLLRATRWCKNIFLIFSKKIHLNQRCGRLDAQVMFWMTFCCLGLLGNKQPSTKVASERRIMKVCFGGCHSNYWWN